LCANSCSFGPLQTNLSKVSWSERSIPRSTSHTQSCVSVSQRRTWRDVGTKKCEHVLTSTAEFGIDCCHPDVLVPTILSHTCSTPAKARYATCAFAEHTLLESIRSSCSRSSVCTVFFRMAAAAAEPRRANGGPTRERTRGCKGEAYGCEPCSSGFTGSSPTTVGTRTDDLRCEPFGARTRRTGTAAARGVPPPGGERARSSSRRRGLARV